MLIFSFLQSNITVQMRPKEDRGEVIGRLARSSSLIAVGKNVQLYMLVLQCICVYLVSCPLVCTSVGLRYGAVEIAASPLRIQ